MKKSDAIKHMIKMRLDNTFIGKDPNVCYLMDVNSINCPGFIKLYKHTRLDNYTYKTDLIVDEPYSYKREIEVKEIYNPEHRLTTISDRIDAKSKDT